MTNTVACVLRSVSTRMKDAGVENPRGNAEEMLCRVLGVDRFSLYLEPSRSVPRPDRHRVDRFVERRLDGEPLQYIVGGVNFLGVDLSVRPGVLIPRPETELLALEAERLLGGKECPTIVDAGCGSGAITCYLADRIEGIQAIAVDKSWDALECALRNLARCGLSDVQALHGDFGAFPLADGSLDLIVSNPPYIATDDLPGLAVEVVGHEPLLALDGGEDGLASIRAIVIEADRLLCEGGSIVMEVGAGQAGCVAHLLEQRIGPARICRDLAGIERVVSATRSGPARVTGGDDG